MWDKLAKVIAEIQKMHVLNKKLTRALEEGDRIITEMMKNDSLKRNLKIYGNPPRSTVARQCSCATEEGTFCRKEQDIRTNRRKDRQDAGPQARPRRRLPPPKIQRSDTPQIEQVRRHQRLGRLHHCQTNNLHRTDAKSRDRDTRVPRVHLLRLRCCHRPETARNPGNVSEPNLLAFLTGVWGKAISAGNATALLNYTFGA